MEPIGVLLCVMIGIIIGIIPGCWFEKIIKCDEYIIKIHNTPWGRGKIFINEELISTKWFSESYKFEYDKKPFEVLFSDRTFFLGVGIELKIAGVTYYKD